MKKLIASFGTVLLLSSIHIDDTHASETEYRSENVDALTEAYEDMTITIGVYDGGETTYYVYTADDSVEAGEVYNYEIGSVTKTFTGYLVAEAVDEGLLELDAPIDTYLPLEAADYPTIRDLLTHTGGYETFYTNAVISQNLILDMTSESVNPYNGVTREMMLNEAFNNVSDTDDNDYMYSNFSTGLLGMVLEEVHDQSYGELVEGVLATHEMNHSSIFDEDADFGVLWTWEDEDGYAPAGAIVSNIEDMLKYLSAQFENEAVMTASHEPLKNIDQNNEEINSLGIYMDDVAYQWIVDNENEFIFHDGQTGGYGSFVGFSKESDVGVVVLMNLPIESAGMATIIGYEVFHTLVSE